MNINKILKLKNILTQGWRIFSSVLVLNLALNLVLSPIAFSLPSDYSVESGDVSFDLTSENTLTITASDNAIINFGSFSIGENEFVYFVQPGAGSSVLGRVVGSSSSELFGGLYANGQFLLVNTNGIHFGASADIQVGSLIASTLDIQSAMYLNNQYVFENPEGTLPAGIFNEANITVTDGGYLVLLSNSIQNSGVLTANLGSVVLGTGEKQTLSFDQNGLINLVIDRGVANELVDSGALIHNTGSLVANGGKVLLTAKTLNDTFDLVINNEGLIEASQAVERDGMVELVSNGAIQSLGTLRTDHLIEDGAAFKIGGDYHVGLAEVINRDDAVTLATGNYSGTTSDAADIIVDDNAVITLTGDTIFQADSDANGSGAFTMNTGSSLNGGTYNLTISASQNSTLRSISNLGSLTLSRSALSSIPTYTIINGGLQSYNLTVNGQSVTQGTLTINTGVTLDTAGNSISQGALENHGTLVDTGFSPNWGFDGNVMNYAGATITATDGDMYVGGNFTNSGTFNHNSGTVVFDGLSGTTQTFDSGSSEFSTIGHTATNTLTLANNLVASILSNSPNSTLNAGSYDIEADLLINGGVMSGTGSWTFSTIALNLAGGQISAREIHTEDFTNSGTVTAGSGDWTVNGYFVNSSGGVFTASTGAISINKDFTNNSGATFTSTSGNLNVEEVFTNNGTFNHNSGTVVLTNQGGHQTVTGSTTFYNLTKIATEYSELEFDSAYTQTVQGTLTLKGVSAVDYLAVFGYSYAAPAQINAQGPRDIDFIFLKNVHNINSTPIDLAGKTYSLDVSQGSISGFIDSSLDGDEPLVLPDLGAKEDYVTGDRYFMEFGVNSLNELRTEQTPFVSLVMQQGEIVSEQLQLDLGEFLDENSSDMAVSEDGTVAYISNSVDDTIKVVDLKTKTLIGSFSAGTGPSSMLLTRDGKAIFVFNRLDQSISMMNPITGAQEALLTLASPGDKPGIPATDEYVQLLMNDALMNSFTKESQFPAASTTTDGQVVFYMDKATQSVALVDSKTGKTEGIVSIGPTEAASTGFPPTDHYIQLLMNDGMMAELLK